MVSLYTRNNNNISRNHSLRHQSNRKLSMNLICPPIHSFGNSFNEFNHSNNTFASYDSICINTTAPIRQFVLLPFNRKIMYVRGGTTTLLGGALVLLLIKITPQCKISIQTFSYSSSQSFSYPSVRLLCGRCAAIPHHTSA